MLGFDFGRESIDTAGIDVNEFAFESNPSEYVK